MGKASPTSRTLTHLRRRGFTVAVVERWIPRLNRRSDLWGFADVLTVHPRDRAFLLVQVTTIDHVAGRLEKARSCPELAAWLRTGGAFEVHGWYQRAGTWQVKIVSVQAGELATVVVQAPRRRGKRSVQGELFADIAQQ